MDQPDGQNTAGGRQSPQGGRSQSARHIRGLHKGGAGDARAEPPESDQVKGVSFLLFWHICGICYYCWQVVRGGALAADDDGNGIGTARVASGLSEETVSAHARADFMRIRHSGRWFIRA